MLYMCDVHVRLLPRRFGFERRGSGPSITSKRARSRRYCRTHGHRYVCDCISVGLHNSITENMLCTMTKPPKPTQETETKKNPTKNQVKEGTEKKRKRKRTPLTQQTTRCVGRCVLYLFPTLLYPSFSLTHFFFHNLLVTTRQLIEREI